ncbi:conserved hypothetical protein [Pyrobaculum islandicum DSM 4184]|uniref:Uncharacterized protein n=1 Tax=Pyrobaculum islandicum (strain DSM 4184 / JCM 9189 / GEO3) TaxID=384616 RepID=A1RSQ3_PYRIL|nr:hypothetical protein [Pyrobaculum islandicum]ABL87985.1 conserved hypothetical protein [Pyrobaculum islandicum DSM 4184]
MLSELYKAGKIKQETLGVLAKTIICIKIGCLPSGPEVIFGNVVLQLAESLSTSKSKQAQPKALKQERTLQQPKLENLKSSRVQVQLESDKSKSVESKEPKSETKVELVKEERISLDKLTTLLAEEAKIDKAKADSVINTLFNYLSVYPSVGVLRLIEDIARMTKVEGRVVRAALEILRSADLIDLKEEGVVNLKRQIRRGELPL